MDFISCLLEAGNSVLCPNCSTLSCDRATCTGCSKRIPRRSLKYIVIEDGTKVAVNRLQSEKPCYTHQPFFGFPKVRSMRSDSIPGTSSSSDTLELVKGIFIPYDTSEHIVIKMKIFLKEFTDHHSGTEELCVYPLPPARKEFSLCCNDLIKLIPGYWLNDAIIGFYLTYLKDTKFPDLQDKMTIYSSYFYTSLESFAGMREINPSRLQRRIRMNLFEKDFVVVPINQNNQHWVILIIYHPCHIAENVKESRSAMNHAVRGKRSQTGPSKVSATYEPNEGIFNDERPPSTPCLLLFDSLNFKYSSFDMIKRYLSCEYKRFYSVEVDFSNMPSYYVPCAKQANTFDCGVFSLEFVEYFMEHAEEFRGGPLDVRFPFNQRDITTKRYSLLKLFSSLIREQQRSKAN